MDILFKKCFDDLMNIANKEEKIQKSLKECSENLSVNVDLILLLIKLRFNINEETYK